MPRYRTDSGESGLDDEELQRVAMHCPDASSHDFSISEPILTPNERQWKMTTDFEVQRPIDAHRIERTERARSSPIRSQIISYLASHGASKVTDISNGIASSRGSVRYHLAALESAEIVRSNISPGARGRFTPFYGLAPGETD